MGNALVIVWRECLEGILVVALIQSILTKQFEASPLYARARRFLWIGVGAGIALSLALGAAILRAEASLEGNGLEIFQVALVLVAALLMTQMVVWMNRHAKTLKKDLERDMGRSVASSKLWGIAAVAALSLAREGSEAVVYIYGLSLEPGAASPVSLVVASVLGVVLAIVSAVLVARGAHYLNMRLFFRLTSAVLLLSAGGLVVTGVTKLVGMDFLPALGSPIWDTSWILDSNSAIGGFFSSFTGYRARPSGAMALALIVYWGIALSWIQARRGPAQLTAAH